jgi:plasmid stabilization system protein ParE
VTAKKRLEVKRRAERDLEKIEAYYLDVADANLADAAIDCIIAQARKIAALGLLFRPGSRAGTRECVLKRFPYILVHSVRPHSICLLRIIHQRSQYFQRPLK